MWKIAAGIGWGLLVALLFYLMDQRFAAGVVVGLLAGGGIAVVLIALSLPDQQ